MFRSDPVLSFDAQGKFYYMSATLDLTTFEITTQLFSSTDGGKTWGAGVQAFGGDKEWMTVDRTHGIGQGHVYETWAAEARPPTSFSRSIDDGQSFQSPTIVPQKPIWGTLDVGPDGTLYAVGVSNEFEPEKFFVSRSKNAQDPMLRPRS